MDTGKLIDSMKRVVKSELGSYDTTATVKRVEGNTAWVHIPGGVDETPVRLTMNAKEGDNVQVRVSDGKAFLAGNVSAPPTDDTTAEAAKALANRAAEDAGRAKSAADIAESYATSAQASAAQSANILEGMEQAAIAAGTTLDGIYADAAEAKATTDEINDYADTAGKTVTQILDDGETAGAAASAAQQAADTALVNLATTEDVVGVLNWITAHGTMVSQYGEVFDPDKVYFIVDPTGDYVVSGTHYSVVPSPVAEDIDSYYILNISESVQNYVATHIVVDTEGLWIIPDAGGNKVLIATGSGSTYTTAGTYIVGKVGGVDKVVAFFRANGGQVGQDNETHTTFDYHSLQLVDKEGNTYFHVSDLRDSNGVAEVTDIATSDGYMSDFYLSAVAVDTSYSVTVSDGSGGTIVKSTSRVSFSSYVTAGATVTVVYNTTSEKAKAYTLGARSAGSVIGLHSIAEGYDNKATAFCSHAEGSHAEATMRYSHSEGLYTHANGYASHAEGYGSTTNESGCHAEGYFTTANGVYSHAEGYRTTADALYSHAEGDETIANDISAHAEGEQTIADGWNSHAEGEKTTTVGRASHSQNLGTITKRLAETAIGRYNVPCSDGGAGTYGEYALEIGNGTSDSARSNALTVDWSGNVEAAGNVTDGAGNVLANKRSAAFVQMYHGNRTLNNTASKITGLSISAGGNYSDYFDVGTADQVKIKKTGGYRIDMAMRFSSVTNAGNVKRISLYRNGSEFVVLMSRANSWEDFSTFYTQDFSVGDVLTMYGRSEDGNATASIERIYIEPIP